MSGKLFAGAPDGASTRYRLRRGGWWLILAVPEVVIPVWHDWRAPRGKRASRGGTIMRWGGRASTGRPYAST